MVKRYYIYYPFVTIVLILLSCRVHSGIENSERKQESLAALNTKISSWIDSGYYNGASLKIVKDNVVLFKADYGGYSDTTTLHVASAGKWVAAATIAAVVDEGKLSWDDKVSKYLPQLTDTKGDVTLRQLLSHTAGYPDYQPRDKKQDDYQTLKEAVANILDLSADTLPGTKFRYGGLAMQVAGRMAEIATGKDWETLFQEKLAKPLNMNWSHFVPVSHEQGFSPMLGGGFVTCVQDYMNFLNMFLHYGLFENNRVLSEFSVKEIEADQVHNAIVNQPEYVANARQNLHNGIYGLGCWREEVNEEGSVTLISSPGWAGTYPWIDRKNNVSGIIIAKVNEPKAKEEGFSSFYGSAVIPIIIRDAITQSNYPKEVKKGMVDIGNNIQLYYEEMGQGEPIIFIHGHSLDHKMWDEQFFEFARDYRAIRYDLRGYGYSSPQQEQQQFTHVEDLIRLMDTLKLEKAHIVGLSLGGYIGTDILGLHPERLLSVTLASGNLRSLPKPSVPMDEAEARVRDEQIALLKQKGIDVMKREWFNGLMRSGGTLRYRMQKPLWNMIYQWDAWQPLHKEARVIAGDDAFDKLKVHKPNIPVLILEGKSENNYFAKDPEILKYLPNARRVILDDCGHMLNMEQPEKFNTIVRNFLNTKR